MLASGHKYAEPEWGGAFSADKIKASPIAFIPSFGYNKR